MGEREIERMWVSDRGCERVIVYVCEWVWVREIVSEWVDVGLNVCLLYIVKNPCLLSYIYPVSCSYNVAFHPNIYNISGCV